jgi:hypothetical protein
MNEKEEEVKECSTPGAEDSCPACLLMRALKGRLTRYSGFFDHLYEAQMEMLRAFRSLVDARITALEGRKSSHQNEKRATRIDVE